LLCNGDETHLPPFELNDSVIYMLCSYIAILIWTLSFLPADLRDDKQFFTDHPGTAPITTTQGEELKRVIGAASYIECSSKTQQVCLRPILQYFKLSCRVCYATMCQV
jgi:hypothetical protein